MPRSITKLQIILMAAFAGQLAYAGEGLWPIQALPNEQIQKECDFTPDAAWIDHIRQACVKVGPQGSGGGGSGAFVSHNGLVVTNRHCVVDALSQLSNATRNLVKDGMYAATPEQELDGGLEIYVLAQARNVTDKAKQDLGDTPSPEKMRRLRGAIQRSAPKGTYVDLVSYFGGAQYWVYIYQTFPAKLVFVPEENFGAFGGEDDNFCYPRHKLDVAFLRAYKDGKPVSSEHMFAISATGPKDGDLLFVAGHPGFSQRHLPIAEIEYLRDVDLPLKVATYEAVVKALTAYMDTGEEQRKKTAGDFEHWANEMKIYQGALKYFKTQSVVDARKKLEQQWRDDLSKSKSKDDFLKAFDDLAAARKDLSGGAALRHFSSMPRGTFYGLLSSLNRFAEATRGKTDEEIQPVVKSFSGFLDHILDSSMAPNLDAERTVLTAWLTAAKEKLPADSPFLKIALNGQPPEAAAKHLLENAEQLLNKEKLIAIISKGAAGIEGTQVPLLKALDEIAALNKDGAANVAAEENRCQSDLLVLERGLSEAYGAALAPEASNTLRLGWGNVCGYKEDGKDIPWSTTLESMIALSDAKKHKYPYELSDKFKAAQKNVDVKTPLDFVSTLDGAPGSSGSPIFTKDAKLVGVLFDGNQQDVPTIYDYIPKETGARAIAVDSAAIWAALEKVYDAKALVEELKGK